MLLSMQPSEDDFTEIVSSRIIVKHNSPTFKFNFLNNKNQAYGFTKKSEKLFPDTCPFGDVDTVKQCSGQYNAFQI